MVQYGQVSGSRRQKWRLPEALENAAEYLRYAADPRALKPGHRLLLLQDGEQAYPEMLRAISRATTYVHLETYVYGSDSIGLAFAEVLIERARKGVAVRLLIDAFGSLLLSPQLLDRLRDQRVSVVEYRRIRDQESWRRWFRRDHRKILVVDGERAFVGGLNIGCEYAPTYAGGKGWRDTHLRVEGPVVADLEEMFRTTWLDAGGAPYRAYPRDADESVAVFDSELAAVVSSDHHGRRSAIRRHLRHAIKQARDTIYISSAYFVPDRALRRALVRAVRRGVQVHLIVPAHSDVAPVQWAGEHTYAQLLRGGVHIHQWTESHMHAKTAVIDGVWAMVGSYNLDYVSLFFNLEVVVELVGRKTGSALRARFEQDRARCIEIERSAWSRRPWWRRALGGLMYRFRRWL